MPYDICVGVLVGAFDVIVKTSPMVRLQLCSQPQIFQTKLTVWLRRPKSFLYGIIQEWVSLAKLPKLGIDTKTSAQDLLLPLFTL